MRYHILAMTFTLALAWLPVEAQEVLFESNPQNHIFYRIPAIVNNRGNLIAFTDDRSGVTDATAWGDIGSEGNISIVARQSSDGGVTWNKRVTTVAAGTGRDAFDRAHGDAAVVSDRKSGRLLAMCASGGVCYVNSKVAVVKDGTGCSLDFTDAIRVGRYYSDDGGASWHGGDVTESIYRVFDVVDGKSCADSPLPVTRLFFSSGRIMQSATIKCGKYHRIYSALTTNQGALVIYSDDFGGTWHALGGATARPAPQGDESKVEELPDGSVLLSCRTVGGRYFNVFRYASVADGSGSWGEPVTSKGADGAIDARNNACNGELLIVPARDSRGDRVYVALQSVPYGVEKYHDTSIDSRQNVSVFWKVLRSPADFASPRCFVSGWRRYQVSDSRSAYSTMVLDDKGDVAFLYENDGEVLQLGSRHTDVYDITFVMLSIEQITGGELRYSGDKSHRGKFLKK